jgi:dienelactone hydrolase
VTCGLRLLLLGIGLASWLGAGAGWAGALIEFPNVSDQAKPQHLLGYLARPDGPGPFPAVVVLHGCAGISGASAGTADQLKAWGYVALAIDSLGPRGISDHCSGLFIEQAIDAYAALKYLSRQSFVDPGRVAVLGYSMGGGSALDDVQRGFINRLFPEKFAAAIAYYPWCRGRSAMVDAPTMILIGAADDWTLAEGCRELVAQPHDGGAPVDLTVYLGAHHGFNFRGLQPGIRRFGHWLEYNEPAATDAWEKVRAFLAANLRTVTADRPVIR